MGQERTLCGDGRVQASLAGTTGPQGMRSCAEGCCEIISGHYGRGLTISHSVQP